MESITRQGGAAGNTANPNINELDFPSTMSADWNILTPSNFNDVFSEDSASMPPQNSTSSRPAPGAYDNQQFPIPFNQGPAAPHIMASSQARTLPNNKRRKTNAQVPAGVVQSFVPPGNIPPPQYFAPHGAVLAPHVPPPQMMPQYIGHGVLKLQGPKKKAAQKPAAGKVKQVSRQAPPGQASYEQMAGDARMGVHMGANSSVPIERAGYPHTQGTILPLNHPQHPMQSQTHPYFQQQPYFAPNMHQKPQVHAPPSQVFSQPHMHPEAPQSNMSSQPQMDPPSSQMPPHPHRLAQTQIAPKSQMASQPQVPPQPQVPTQPQMVPQSQMAPQSRMAPQLQVDPQSQVIPRPHVNPQTNMRPQPDMASPAQSSPQLRMPSHTRMTPQPPMHPQHQDLIAAQIQPPSHLQDSAPIQTPVSAERSLMNDPVSNAQNLSSTPQPAVGGSDAPREGSVAQVSQSIVPTRRAVNFGKAFYHDSLKETIVVLKAEDIGRLRRNHLAMQTRIQALESRLKAHESALAEKSTMISEKSIEIQKLQGSLAESKNEQRKPLSGLETPPSLQGSESVSVTPLGVVSSQNPLEMLVLKDVGGNDPSPISFPPAHFEHNHTQSIKDEDVPLAQRKEPSPITLANSAIPTPDKNQLKQHPHAEDVQQALCQIPERPDERSLQHPSPDKQSSTPVVPSKGVNSTVSSTASTQPKNSRIRATQTAKPCTSKERSAKDMRLPRFDKEPRGTVTCDARSRDTMRPTLQNWLGIGAKAWMAKDAQGGSSVANKSRPAQTQRPEPKVEEAVQDVPATESGNCPPAVVNADVEGHPGLTADIDDVLPNTDLDDGLNVETDTTGVITPVVVDENQNDNDAIATVPESQIEDYQPTDDNVLLAPEHQDLFGGKDEFGWDLDSTSYLNDEVETHWDQ